MCAMCCRTKQRRWLPRLRLDYCNAILYGAPRSSLDKLQRAQNNLARVVCQRSRITDARPLLQSLHWLPIRERILYKTALLAFKTRLTSSPPYLTDLLQLRPPTRLLRSSDAPLLTVPRTQTALATRAFLWLRPLCGTVCRPTSGRATRCWLLDAI